MNLRACSLLIIAMCALPLGFGRAQERHVDVLVVDGVTGLPVKDAEVEWLVAPTLGTCGDDTAHGLLDLNGWPSGPMMGDAHNHSSDCYVLTDSAGLARISAATEYLRIIASSPGRWGWSAFRPNSEAAIRIALFDDSDLTVRVADTLRHPVDGVDVWLCEKPSVRGDDAIPLWIAPVDRGVARLEHFGAWIRERDFEASSRDSHWFLELGSLHAKLSAVPVDARTRGPVEFVLPPSGELEVEIVDADGTPVTPSEPVAIELASRATRTQSSTNEDGDTLMLTFAPAPGNASPRSLAIDGRALFRNLPLSQRFAVFVRRNAVSEACCIECIGPHRAGERSRARIELGHSTVTVSARLITPSGAPLSKACVQVAVQHDASKRMPEWVRSGSLVSFYQVGLAAPSPYCSVVSRTTTDGDGWLRVDLDPWTASSGAPYLVVESDTGLPSALGTRIPLARAWHVGATDLGDVALANPGILIAGRVVGSDGAPVSGVEFSWQWSWYTPALTAYSDASGIFAMSTSLSCDEVMPLIRRDGYAPVTLRDIASGSAGIEVVLRRAARVRGRLRAPDAAHRLGDDEPRVWLIQNGECEGRWPQCVSARLSTDGSFESESLGPGSWRLTIRQHEETREIDITAREGETLDVGEIELDGGR